MAAFGSDTGFVPRCRHPCGAPCGHDMYDPSVMAGRWRLRNHPGPDRFDRRDTKP